MDGKASRAQLLDAFSAIAASLRIADIDILKKGDAEFTSIVRASFDDAFVPLPHSVLAEHKLIDSAPEAPSLSREIVKSPEGKDVYCALSKFRMPDGTDGLIVIQAKAAPDKSADEILSFFVKAVSLIGGTGTSPSDPSAEKFKAELAKLRHIQAKLFPKFGKVEGLDIASVYLPVELMSGNFVDAFYLDPSLYQITACNVSGFDASSAFTGSAIRTLIRSFSSKNVVPSALIDLVNGKLQKIITDVHFLIYLVTIQVNPATGRVKMSSLGDIDTIFYSAAKKKTFSLNRSSIGMELAKRVTLKDINIQLDPGDTLLYFSTGVKQATTEDGSKQYGEERLAENLLRAAGNASVEIVHGITQEIYEFSNYSPLDNDMILVAIKRSPLPAAPEPAAPQKSAPQKAAPEPAVQQKEPARDTPQKDSSLKSSEKPS